MKSMNIEGLRYAPRVVTAATGVGLRIVAAFVYSAALGYLVAGLFWQAFNPWLPPSAVAAIGAALGIRVATLFASMTAAAVLNWKAIWIGGGVGVSVLIAGWPATIVRHPDPPRGLLLPILIATLVVVATAGTLRSRKGAHFYNSARFARSLHHLQGFLLFGAALPASLAWEWTRPYVVGVILSAFLLWELWDGACPVTLSENEARQREGLPVMPPEGGFIPDVLARFGVAVSGHTVALVFYGIGFSLCGWFGISWMF
jgi:divalent metal cation (Fe/Co/Zn/Cd) transporter